MIAHITYIVALVARALWFSAAFRYFSFQQTASAKVLAPLSARLSPLFPILAAFIRFLGGMNGAFALFAILLLICATYGSNAFADPIDGGLVLLVFSAAHFSQFFFNVTVLMAGERQGECFWYVRSGPMLFIFVIDVLEAVINFGAAIIQFDGWRRGTRRSVVLAWSQRKGARALKRLLAGFPNRTNLPPPLHSAMAGGGIRDTTFKRRACPPLIQWIYRHDGHGLRGGGCDCSADIHRFWPAAQEITVMGHWTPLRISAQAPQLRARQRLHPNAVVGP